MKHRSTYIAPMLDDAVLRGLEFTIPCEGSRHTSSLDGHAAAQPASWLLLAPCGGIWAFCDAWVVTECYDVVCLCGDRHLWSKFRIEPIGKRA